MTKRVDDTRAGLWILLGTQPGLGAWHAVRMLARLMPRTVQAPQQPEAAGAPAPRPVRRVRAGTHAYQEQARP